MTGTPAGWHPAPDKAGELRYWDGGAWTDHYAPAAAPVPEVASKPSRPLGDQAAETLWESVGKPVTGIGAGRYRLTPHYLYFERGTLSTDSQQVPVSALLDVDVKQSMTQKARSVGTLLVKIQRSDRVELVQIVDVPNFRDGQHAITNASHQARTALQRAQNTMTYQHQGAAGGHSSMSGSDPYAQLEQLARLRDAGVLSDEEFAAKKAEILSRL